MNVLVDTSVWSLALRRRKPDQSGPVRELRELIVEGRAKIIGIIRQEVLSGVREQPQFLRLRESLRAFPDEVTATADHERAAEHFNTCRRRGVQGSIADYLICAVAERLELAILTTDADFQIFAEHIPIRLHQVRSATRQERHRSTQ
jgi:predicted nucleic acid-binding protein